MCRSLAILSTRRRACSTKHPTTCARSIRLRRYAKKKNPKQGYKRSASEPFSTCLTVRKIDMARILMSLRTQSLEDLRGALAIEERLRHIGNSPTRT